MISMDFTGKVAIVTGGARGIGFQIAKAFAQNGGMIVIADLAQSTSDEAAEKLAKEFGVDAIGVAVDVSSYESSEQLIKTVVDKFGRVDILVNNAGITKDNLLLRMKPEDWQQVINVNLNSVFNTTKSVLRTMLKQKYGRIVNVSSVVGLMGNAGQANYAASKAGVIGFTKTMAREVGAKGITCNAVAPGYIETDMIKTLPKEYLENIMNAIPQKRLGKPEEVAYCAMFLASDLAAHITGQVISIDGGTLM